MQVSVDWLRDYVKLDASTHEIAERLTDSLNEVDEIRSFDHLKRIKVGEVLSVEKHPDADSLWVTKTAVGSRRYTIVCGADNVVAGAKVAVALPGVTLPDGLKIGKRRIRGIESNGMICSPKELGIGEDHSGIWLLPADVEPGQSLPQALKGAADTFELDTPANRPDTLGHLGIAREAAAAFGKPLKVPRVPAVRRKRGIFALKVADATACPRYQLVRLSGVQNGESPEWLKRRLTSVGLRPINAVVDVTNFVMLETGQPLHAFDVSKVTGTVVFVRDARKGESVTTLDKQQRSLTTADLVIADRTQVIGIAGVMGGQSTEVSKRSTDILLECAVFDPARIRRTSRRLGLRSDASARFEKGPSPAVAGEALTRAVALLKELCGGSVIQAAESYPRKRPNRPIRLDLSRLAGRIGAPLTPAVAARYLKRLGFAVRTSTTSLTATAPNWRTDVSEEADLVEEIVRLHGYATVPATVPRARLAAGERPPGDRLRRQLTTILTGAGYSEVITHSLVGRKLVEKAGYSTELVKMANPLSEDQAFLRRSMEPRHLEAVRDNLRWADELRCFEIGKTFKLGRKGSVAERNRLMVTAATKPPTGQVRDIRGLLTLIVRQLRIADTSIEFVPLKQSHYAAGQQFDVVHEGTVIGHLAAYGKPAAWKAGSIAFLSLELDRLLSRFSESIVVSALPPYPPVYRDVSVFVPEGKQYADVISTIRATTAPFLQAVGNPTEFQKDGKRSITARLTFRSPERTLKDAEVNQAMKAIGAALAKAGFEVRE